MCIRDRSTEDERKRLHSVLHYMTGIFTGSTEDERKRLHSVLHYMTGIFTGSTEYEHKRLHSVLHYMTATAKQIIYTVSEPSSHPVSSPRQTGIHQVPQVEQEAAWVCECSEACRSIMSEISPLWQGGGETRFNCCPFGRQGEATDHSPLQSQPISTQIGQSCKFNTHSIVGGART